MPWFKVDDGFPTHRKILSIPRGSRRLAAAGAWTFAGAWSSANLTEGYIPKTVLPDLGITPAAANDLVTAGLWLTEPDGYRMHDFLIYNPSADRVRADRAAAAERQRKAREKAASRRESHRESRRDTTDPSRRESRVSHAGSHGPPDPTRPDPSTRAPHVVLIRGDVEEDVDVDATHASNDR